MAQQKITSSDITSVANTAISGNIISSQITSVSNTQISGLITPSQLSPFASVTADNFIPNNSTVPTNGIYLPATNSIGIATNSVSRVQVNASGIMTNPYQPGFIATGNGGSVTITSSANIPFNTLVSSLVGSTRSSGYNTSTYAYTAPVSGLYCFYAQVYVSTTNSLAWLKNGSQLAYQDVALWSFSNQSSVTQIMGGSIIVELAAGDYISTRVRSGEASVNVYMGHSSFLGYLIG